MKHLRLKHRRCKLLGSKVYGANLGFPWSFFFLIAASITEMMQVAMNEWGHSLWITEEIFAAPFHWPFTMYGWLAGGMFALWGETILRLYQVEKQAEEADATAIHVANESQLDRAP